MIEKLQYITQDSPELTHSEQAAVMFRNGVKWVQLRMKNAKVQEVIDEARISMVYAMEYNATLILNDSVEIAKELGVKAVHLGLNDMPINEARKVLGNDVIIGGTANTYEQIKLQVERGADYVGVGPYRFTTTKKNLSPVVGLDGYKVLTEQMKNENIDIPMFAVGGIEQSDIKLLSGAGINHYAVSGAMLKEYLKNKKINIEQWIS